MRIRIRKNSGYGGEEKEEGGDDSGRYEFTSLHELRSDRRLTSFSSQEPTTVAALKTPPLRHRQQLHALTDEGQCGVHAYPEETTST